MQRRGQLRWESAEDEKLLLKTAPINCCYPPVQWCIYFGEESAMPKRINIAKNQFCIDSYQKIAKFSRAFSKNSNFAKTLKPKYRVFLNFPCLMEYIYLMLLIVNSSTYCNRFSGKYARNFSFFRSSFFIAVPFANGFDQFLSPERSQKLLARYNLNFEKYILE